MFDAQAEVEKHSNDYPPFPFKGLDGETYELPHPLTLTERQAARVYAGDMDNVFEELAPEAAEAIRDLPGYVSVRLITEWQNEMGDLGKALSELSDGKITELPSPPTSPFEASTSTS